MDKKRTADRGLPLFPNGWPDVRRGDFIEVLSGPLKGIRSVEGMSNKGGVAVENPATGMHEFVKRWRKLPPMRAAEPRPWTYICPDAPAVSSTPPNRRREAKGTLAE